MGYNGIPRNPRPKQHCSLPRKCICCPFQPLVSLLVRTFCLQTECLGRDLALTHCYHIVLLPKLQGNSEKISNKAPGAPSQKYERSWWWTNLLMIVIGLRDILGISGIWSCPVILTQRLRPCCDHGIPFPQLKNPPIHSDITIKDEKNK